MKAAIYARVSTSDQNCALQLAELNGYCERAGWTVYAEYVDAGISGAKASRPELDRLKADARMRRFDVVVVWKLDRWGRSMVDCIHGIQELAALKIRFLAITQAIDTDHTSPVSKLLLNLLAAFAEFERELIRERIRAGVAAARSKGVKLGRTKKVFDREEALDLQQKGASVRTIARRLGVTKSVVQRFLKDTAG